MGKKRRFQRGTEDLEQLEDIETQQQRSRKARRKLAKTETEPAPAALGPLIQRIDKSKKRVRNRLAQIKDYEDAIREFGS